MEHVQDSAESIGAMLSDIAESLREVSRKLDLVATRVDLPLPVPLPDGERDLATRLAALEAWAFRTDSDVADLGKRMDVLQTAADAPATGRRHAAGSDEGRRADSAPLGRRAARRLGISGDGEPGAEGAGDDTTPAVPRRLSRGGAHSAGGSADAAAAEVDRTAGSGTATTASPVHEVSGEAGDGARARESGRTESRRERPEISREPAQPEAAPTTWPALGDRAEQGPARTAFPEAGALSNGSGPGGSHAAASDAAPAGPADVTALSADRAAHSTDTVAHSADVAGRPADPSAADLAAPPAGLGARPDDLPDLPGRAADSVAQAPEDARPSENGGGSASLTGTPSPAAPAEGTPLANGTGRRTRADRTHESPVSGDWGTPPQPRHDAPVEPEPPAAPSLPTRTPAAPAAETTEPAAPARPPRPRYAAGSARQRIAEARAESAGRHAPEAPPETPAPPADADEPANLRAAVEARRASGRLPQRGAAAEAGQAPSRPSGLPQRTPVEQTPAVSLPEEPRPGLTRPSDTDHSPSEPWSEPGRNGSNGAGAAAEAPARPPLNLSETMAAAYDQGLREAFTGGEPPSGLPTRTPGSAARDEGFRQAPAAGYPLGEPPAADDGFSAFADHTRTTEQVPRSGWTGPADSVYGPDAARAEDPHQDKLQAMLDELKRTAAATPTRPDVFGPPTGDTPGR